MKLCYGCYAILVSDYWALTCFWVYLTAAGVYGIRQLVASVSNIKPPSFFVACPYVSSDMFKPCLLWLPLASGTWNLHTLWWSKVLANDKTACRWCDCITVQSLYNSPNHKVDLDTTWSHRSSPFFVPWNFTKDNIGKWPWNGHFPIFSL